MAASEQSGIAQVLSCHSVPHHPLKELFESVLPIGRIRIDVVALARFIPYQHQFCGVVPPDAEQFRRDLQSWNESGKSLQDSDGIAIKTMETCWGIRDLQRVAIAGLSPGSLPEGR